jgi:hypothetical protein
MDFQRSQIPFMPGKCGIDFHEGITRRVPSGVESDSVITSGIPSDDTPRKIAGNSAIN